MPDESDLTVQEVQEVRELLAKLQNKDAVARYLQKRGMPEDEAHALVRAVHKDNLWENRKSSLAIIGVSGAAVAVLVGILIFTGRLFYVWLPIAGIGLLWGLVKFCTCSGYEVEPDDD